MLLKKNCFTTSFILFIIASLNFLSHIAMTPKMIIVPTNMENMKIKVTSPCDIFPFPSSISTSLTPLIIEETVRLLPNYLRIKSG